MGYRQCAVMFLAIATVSCGTDSRVVREVLYGLTPSLIPAALDAATLAAAQSPKASEHNQVTEHERALGWHSLFDGNSLQHWRTYGEASAHPHWRADRGRLTLTQKGGGDLITRAVYSDFELRLDWWISEGGNSGIFFLADESALPIFVHAPEVQILDNDAHPDAAQEDRRSGGLYDLIAAPAPAQKPAQQWNRVRIRHYAGHLQVWQNGLLTVDVHIGSEFWRSLVADSKFADWPGFAENVSGHIGLQDHGDVVAFRNLKIRRISGD